MITRLALSAASVLLLVGVCPAIGDTVVLRDGTRVRGTFLRGSTRSLMILDESNRQRALDIRDVQFVEFSPALPLSSGSDRHKRMPEPPAQPNPFVIVPSGTQIVVLTNETVSSSQSDQGHTYDAEIEQDVPDSAGAIAIPRRSPAKLIVRKAEQGGSISSGELILDLYSVTVGGQEYLLSTTDIVQSGRAGVGKNSRTGALVGGGAILGTLLGVIAGGGRGAAIGALAGAGAGAGVQVLTRGKEVKVPAETVLTFRLDQPLRLNRN